MKKKDLNEIAKIEKAISEKYGKEAIINPKSKWDDEKEAQFSKDIKKFYNKIYKNKDYKKRSLENIHPPCSMCGKDFYFMNLNDEIKYYKYGVCSNCYIEHLQGRHNYK